MGHSERSIYFTGCHWPLLHSSPLNSITVLAQVFLRMQQECLSGTREQHWLFPTWWYICTALLPLLGAAIATETGGYPVVNWGGEVPLFHFGG